METLDQHLTESDITEPRPEDYAGFWSRLGAAVLDGLILAPLAVVVVIDIISWKSIPVFLLVNIINLAYKPFMEYRYGATVGKMALGIKVVNLQFQKPNLQEALSRSVFHIIFVLMGVVTTIGIFGLPDFGDVQSLMAYSQFMESQRGINDISTWLPGVVTIGDGIVMVSDDRKRSIHDRIGKTYVIKK